MKTRYIIGGLIIIAFIAQAVYFFDSSQVQYSDFEEARKSGETVQILGYTQKDKPYNYNSDENEFTFYLKDEKDQIAKVVYAGAKPMNFDQAPMVVVKGKISDNTFKANEILTKCPSKYENMEYIEE